MNRIIITLLFLIMLAGCASMNDAMTPSLKVERDDFDSSLRILQPPVSSSGVSDDWHTLGFEWNEKTPKIIYLTVGAMGITNISDAQFNVDGELIDSLKEASGFTSYGDWSTRRFYLPIYDFVKLAKGNLVKMKVVKFDKYSVSAFGEGAGITRTIDQKFPPFLKALVENGAIN
jgi:hypothetical protein